MTVVPHTICRNRKLAQVRAVEDILNMLRNNVLAREGEVMPAVRDHWMRPLATSWRNGLEARLGLQSLCHQVQWVNGETAWLGHNRMRSILQRTYFQISSWENKINSVIYTFANCSALVASRQAAGTYSEPRQVSMQFVADVLPMILAAWSKTWTDIFRSNAGIVGSNPIRGMDLLYVRA
jgi:hypothetical protein